MVCWTHRRCVDWCVNGVLTGVLACCVIVNIIICCVCWSVCWLCVGRCVAHTANANPRHYAISHPKDHPLKDVVSVCCREPTHPNAYPNSHPKAYPKDHPDETKSSKSSNVVVNGNSQHIGLQFQKIKCGSGVGVVLLHGDMQNKLEQ